MSHRPPLVSFLLAGCLLLPPVEGDWRIVENEVVGSTCGPAGVDTFLGGGFSLAGVEDGGIELDLEGGPVLACQRSGRDLACDPALESVPVAGGVLTLEVALSGRFHGRDELEATLDYGISCAGEGCSEVEEDLGAPLPCQVRVEVLAVPGED